MKWVLLPGFMGVADDWRAFAEALSGHGSISPSVLCAPYSGLPEREPFWLCGYSMGGRVAISLAQSPGCRGVISISSSPGLCGDRERSARAEADEQIAARLERLRNEAEFREFLNEWWSQPVFRGSTLTPGQREQLIQSRLSLDPRELAAHLRAFGPAAMPPLWEQWNTLAIPKLAIAGERDPKYAALAREMGEHRILANCGHQVPLEQPAALAAGVLAWRQSLPPEEPV